MTLPIGTILGPYEVRALLGVGGMGEVYRAVDNRLTRTVAIKVLSAGVGGDPVSRQRFEREAQTISRLNHPHICTLFDIGRHGDIQFLVMEYLEGETLAARLEAGMLPLDQALRYGVQIAEALDEAHRHGVVHRDLKPGNIMLTPAGAKLLDFGLAKPWFADIPSQDSVSSGPLTASRSLTAEGTVVGTPGYMAPEQLAGKDADAAADLFALGAVLFEMVTHRRAFDGPSNAHIVAAVMTSTPPPISQLRDDVPAALDRLVGRCLAKDPDERWQTARDLASELKWIVDSSSAMPAPPSVVARSRGTRTWRAAAAAIALLVFVPLSWMTRDRPIDSIAILPLENVGGDPQMEYLSDGITESLIRALSPVPAIKVMSGASVSRYKGQVVDPRAVAKVLNVRSVLIGKVASRDGQLSVIVEVIDARDNRQIWGEHYTRPLAAIFAIQDDISKETSEQLRLRLSGREALILRKRFTDSTEAYELYLKGRYYWSRRTPQDLTRSVQFFKEAIEIDPRYALANAGLADAYNVLGSMGYDILPPLDVIPKAKAAAAEALRLDDQLAEAHAAMGFVLRFEWQRTDAAREHQRAVELNPNYATGRQWLASSLWTAGRFDEALVQLQEAQTLDPLSPLISLNLGRHYYYQRDYDRAIPHLNHTLELDGHNVIAAQLLALVYYAKGEPDQAIARLRISPAPPGPFLSVLGYVSGATGDPATARRVLADLQALSMHRYIPAYAHATVYAGLGMKDEAFEQLERACIEHSGYLDYLGVEPTLDRLRDDPRFDDLLRRVSLPTIAVRTMANGRPAS